MSIVKDLLCIVLFLILFFALKKNLSLKHALFNQRDYFIKTLSHDLRVSTLAQIRGLDLLKSEGELVDDIKDSCKYSLDMISMLLDTYRYENGEQVLNYEIFNLSDIIRECCRKLALKASEKGVAFYNNIKNIELVEADKLELEKTLKYLISTTIFNSDKNSKIIISVDKKCNNLEVSIIYSGASLTEEECRRMFSNNPRFSTVGHGIKMHLCKKIVEFHGGKIYVKNIDRKINSFTFILPIEKKLASLKPTLLSYLQTNNS